MEAENKSAQAFRAVVRGMTIEAHRPFGAVVRAMTSAQAFGAVVRAMTSAQAFGAVVRGMTIEADRRLVPLCAL